MDEIEIIREYLGPLTEGAPGALNLTDDAALAPNAEYVCTTDILIAGVHFLQKDPLDLIARKLLRVNLSDIAAMGAKPLGYLLGCAWPVGTTRKDIKLFAEGLREDQNQYKVALFGGDTTVHAVKSAPLTISATVFGKSPKQGVTTRAGAAPGDDLYVSGAIGDAGLGFRALTRKERFTPVDKASVANLYRLPEPRLSLGAALPGLASAAIDVSDGLLADAHRIAQASGVGVKIFAKDLPLSRIGREWARSQRDYSAAIAELASFGDDYELLFSAPAKLRRSVSVAAKASRTSVTRIGAIVRQEVFELLDDDDDPIDFDRAGYDHFRK